MSSAASQTIVLGVNEGHDGGAALLVDGWLVCAVSEERLNRRRYSSGYLASTSYCLRQAGLEFAQVSLVAVSSYGPRLPRGHRGALAPFGPVRTTVVDHHLAHAYGAFCLSPFAEATVLVIDGEGNDGETESYYEASEDGIGRLGGNDPMRPVVAGIGRTYEAFTNYLGWTAQEAGKTMGLSAYGSPDRGAPRLFDFRGDQVASELEEKYEQGAARFARRHGLDLGPPFTGGEGERAAATAAYVQAETEGAIVGLANRVLERSGERRLCLAGGVALNSNANQKLAETGHQQDLYVMPAASDKGQALGNALRGHHLLTGEMPTLALSHDYWGREYSEAEILEALELRDSSRPHRAVPHSSLDFERVDDPVGAAAAAIEAGMIIGWFQGGSELGPRALGNRSILCDPRRAEMKQTLNDRVKHRERFRPFAPSCTIEAAARFFRVTGSTRFMLRVVEMTEEGRRLLPAVAHVDGTARLQTVSRADNHLFHALLCEFGVRTGIPVLLNTSFNDGEPIVESPSDAVATFLRTDLDTLVIGSFVATKRTGSG